MLSEIRLLIINDLRFEENEYVVNSLLLLDEGLVIEISNCKLFWFFVEVFIFMIVIIMNILLVFGMNLLWLFFRIVFSDGKFFFE